jgi:hypothetical protein
MAQKKVKHLSRKVEVVEIETSHFRNIATVTSLQRVITPDGISYSISTFQGGKKIYACQDIKELSDAYALFKHQVLKSKVPKKM